MWGISGRIPFGLRHLDILHDFPSITYLRAFT
jgi:hypothetical protein